jgi:3-oxoacyl-ACP reductase-like protein
MPLSVITGVGKGSFGVEILKGLLPGGAHVVVTTSRYSRATVEYYQGIFQSFGGRGSALTVVPFNQGSKQDVEALVDYIYTTWDSNSTMLSLSPPFPRMAARSTVSYTKLRNSL